MSYEDSERLRAWKRDGFLLLKDFYNFDTEILPIQREIYKLISRIAHRLNRPIQKFPFSSKAFDDGLQLLIEEHREEASLLYDTVKKLPAYVSLVCGEKNIALAKKLLNSDLVGFAPRGYGMRMDHPFSDEYITQLHQDYTSQLGSPRGVVFWSPLREVDRKLGPVVLFPGSHKLGILPIEVVSKGSYGLRIQNELELKEKFISIAPELNPGDLLVADYLLLHESSPNRGTKTRWAMISRFFDFTEDIGTGYGWKGGLSEGNSFADMHPDKVLKRGV